MVLETLWGVVVALLCFWVASEGSNVRGTLAVVVAMLLVTVCTVVIAVYFASLSLVRKAVADAALGRNIFDALFDHVLGISGADAGEKPVAAKVPTHMSREEIENTLKAASRYLLSRIIHDAWASTWRKLV